MWNGWRHVSVFLLSAPHLQSHHHPLFNHQRNHVSRTFTYCQSFLSRFKVFSLPAMFTPATQGVLVHWWYNKESYLAKACLSLSRLGATPLRTFLPICFHPSVRADQGISNNEKVSRSLTLLYRATAQRMWWSKILIWMSSEMLRHLVWF
jgi:hypothetical protein